jgi:plasmid stabilization system protein ParE
LTAAAAGEKVLLPFAEWQATAGYMFVGKHTVFVLREAEQLLVVRVLHQSSDYVRHLSSS